jgi:integrase
MDFTLMQDLDDKLKAIPRGMLRFKKFKGKSIETIIKEDHKPKLSVPRLKQYWANLGAVFRFGVKRGYMDRNYAEGFRPRQKVRPDLQQSIFTKADLKLLFHCPEYLTFDEPYKFWLPILGLYTGCRIEEICSRYSSDVVKSNGVWCLDIHENRPDQSIKNMASVRLVPLHPVVLELGFLDYINSLGDGLIFPSLKRIDNKYSHYPSRWFGSFKKRAGIEAPPRQKTFHSFRHTLTDNLKQQLIPTAIIDELTGHALQGETASRYGKRLRPRTIYDKALLKLKFGVSLDHLKGSRFVNG